MIVGCTARLVGAPRLDERSFVVQATAPVVDGAVAPGPPLPVSPYFITSVCAEP